MPTRLASVLCLLTFVITAAASAQVVEDRTLLSWDIMNAIAQEASGERALQNVLEQVPYHRVRSLDEYGPDAHFRETNVTYELAKRYGFSDVNIKTYTRDSEDYQPTVGQLWMQGPLPRKLFDIYDTPVALASRSQSGDVTAELVDVGSGANPEDYEGKDVRGKFVLGSTRASTLQRLAVFERGAAGVLSYGTVYPVDQPDAIVSSSISDAGPDGQDGGVGWSISPRIGQELASRLAGGEKVTLRSIVEGHSIPGELEVIHATIPGDGSTDQVLFISAHVFEGYIKMGANDDNSGVGLTLEIGRTYVKLIKDGVLPTPKRTIHFLWIPEFSGTYAWLDENPDLQAAGIANLNFDMEGIQLSTAGSYWVLHRTPDTTPHFVNDVSQSMMEMVAESNRERIRFRGDGYGFTWPVLSPNGSRDPFYISIDKHYGSSDHVAFLQRGIPAVMFITWPDKWYHTSQDLPQKLDPTQFRRAAVVGVGAAAVMASGGDEMAYRVANEVLGRGAERLGANQRKGLGYMGDATSGPELVEAYKEAKNAVLHQAAVEKEALMSTAALYDNPDQARDRVSTLASLIDRRAEALLAEVSASYRMGASVLGVTADEPSETDLEREAARLLVEKIDAGGGTGRRRGISDAELAKLTPDERAAIRNLPSVMESEYRLLISRGMSVFEMRNFLAGEFDPLPLGDFVAYLRAQEKVGLIRLVER